MTRTTAPVFSAEEAFFNLSEGLSNLSRNPNIRSYSPHTKQAIFHKSIKKRKLYIGGNRSGKTVAGICEGIWRASCRHPFRPDINALGPSRGRVVAVDFNSGLEKIIMPLFKQWVSPSDLRGGSWKTAYNVFLRTLHFENGSTIEFMSYDQDLDKFAGTSRHWVHFDEEPPQSIYIENMARLVDTDGDFWITMTPVEGLTWIHDVLYEGNVDNPDGDTEVIEINTNENPFLSESGIKSFTDSIDADEVTARIEGKFVQAGGRIYKNFDPVPGGIHVLKEPIDDPAKHFKDCLWVCSLDHGLNNATAVLWIAFDRNGYGTMFREHYKKEWTIDQHAKEINRINREHGRLPDVFVADPSIQNRNAVTATSIHEEYLKYGLAWILGNNDVAAGIIRVKRYLNPVTALDGKVGKPKLQIAPNCQNFIWEAKRYRWKTFTNKKLRYENNAYELPHKKDDHACDSLRYAIMTRPDLIAMPDSAADKINAMMDEHGFGVAKPALGIADPNDRFSGTGGWTENNSIPRGGSDDWEYDEHMGGIL